MDNIINLIDSNFAHSKLGYSVDFHDTNIFKWNRKNIDLSLPTVFTDNMITSSVYNHNSYAWLLEPISINPNLYHRIRLVNNNFKKVFTHEKTLLDLNQNFEFVPTGGCWIEDEDKGIHKKTKNISIISSDKKQTYGHKLRHEIIKNFSNKIDLYGNGYNPIDKKIYGLKDYRFSLVVENIKRDYYFTEKLIDCFVTGTIPIYWGCPSIGNFFDIRGILVFDTLKDLSNIINNIDEKTYEDMLKYAHINFEKSKNYILPDIDVYNKIISS